MPFWKISPRTTMNAGDVNANFLDARGGSFLPRTPGGVMPQIDSTYDLGSSATTWDYLYCNDFNSAVDFSADTVMEIISDVVSTQTSTYYTISNLNGDNYKYFIIDYYSFKTISQDLGASPVKIYNENMNIYFNSDTATNYNVNRIISLNTTKTVDNSSSFNGANLGITYNTNSTGDASGITKLRIFMTTKTGSYRFINSYLYSFCRTSLDQSRYINSSMWKDKTNTITSITIYPVLSFGADQTNNSIYLNVKLWGIK